MKSDKELKQIESRHLVRYLPDGITVTIQGSEGVQRPVTGFASGQSIVAHHMSAAQAAAVAMGKGKK